MNINNVNTPVNYGKLYQTGNIAYKNDTYQTGLFESSDINNYKNEFNISSNLKPTQLSITGIIGTLLAGISLLTACNKKSENKNNYIVSDENSDIKDTNGTKKTAMPSENGVGRFDIIPESKQLLMDIKNKCENADEFLKNATQTFDMSEEELTEYITEMCNSPQFGNGCIDPIQYFALLAQESEFKNVEGDNGKAVGLGQIHEPAVEEINYQIENNLYDNYDYNNSKTYEASDRWDAKKNIEISLLYLRYCASKTDSTEAMIAMYNTGIPDGIYTNKGFEYVNNVLSKIGESYSYS